MKNTAEALKQEAANATGIKASWRENGNRLIWCGLVDGRYVFHNTTDAHRHGPVISEVSAQQYLAGESGWVGPNMTKAA